MGLSPEDMKQMNSMWKNMDDLSESVGTLCAAVKLHGLCFQNDTGALASHAMNPGPGRVQEVHIGNSGRRPARQRGCAKDVHPHCVVCD